MSVGKKAPVIPSLPRQAMLPLGELSVHPDNYKHHPPSQVVRVAASLKEYGQRKAVPVRETPDGTIIIAGHCVVQALETLAVTNRTKWGYCWVSYVPENWTDAQALAYLIADNKSSEGSEDDYGMLAELVDKQQQGGIDLMTLGFTPQMYKQLIADSELTKAIPTDKGDVPFTEELMEQHSYIVLLFDNEIDWKQLLSLYPLPPVQSLNSKVGYRRVGTGRVVKGPDFIRKIRESNA